MGQQVKVNCYNDNKNVKDADNVYKKEEEIGKERDGDEKTQILLYFIYKL